MEGDLSFDSFQRLVDQWIKSHGDYWHPLSMLSALIEEVGEIARAINSFEGYKPLKVLKNENIGEEIADTIFALTCIANYYKINLSEELKKVLEKYSERDYNRF